MSLRPGGNWGRAGSAWGGQGRDRIWQLIAAIVFAFALATFASVAPISTATSDDVAGADLDDDGDDSGVDISACPSAARPDGQQANRLVGPLAEDDYSEPTEPEVPESEAIESLEAQAQAKPNRDLRPDVRAPNTEIGAAAAVDAGARVHLGSVRWCVIQPTIDGGYIWEPYDAIVRRYRDIGAPVRSIKVVDAPKWAARSSCVSAAAVTGSKIKWCPPRPERQPELRAFARAFARHYGPGGFGIPRISFWNEPNLADNWGREKHTSSSQREADAEEYSDLLQGFYVAATNANPDVKVDAGEVAAGGDLEKGDGVRKWAIYFADYNRNRSNFHELTIHAYSEVPAQIMRKVANYLALPGVPRVGVSEFGWALRSSGTPNNWKCVDSETGEGSHKARFNNVANRVWDSNVTVRRLVWFNLVDNRKDGPKCRDEAWYNERQSPDGPIAGRFTNTFGLFKRRRDGTLPSFAHATPRPLRAAFVCAQQPPSTC